MKDSQRKAMFAQKKWDSASPSQRENLLHKANIRPETIENDALVHSKWERLDPHEKHNLTFVIEKSEPSDKKITMKEFIKSGNYLEDEVRRRADKGSPHFFDKDTMRFFSSRISELMWKDANRNIWFITSEQDKGTTQHAGSVRAFTVRKIDEGGDINKVGDFQGHSTLSEARQAIKDIIKKGNL